MAQKLIVRWSRWIYPVMTTLWLIVIAYGSIDPRPAEEALPALPSLPASSVAAHVGAYGMLGVLLLGSLKAVSTKPLRGAPAPVGAWSLATIYGIAMEMVQLAFPERDASVGDVGWNALGAGLGLVALATWRAIRKPTHLRAAPEAESHSNGRGSA